MLRNNSLDDDCVFEKKKWISITGLCNNNCVFCLDGKRKDTHHKSKKEMFSEIKKGFLEGNTKLILSGGDPSIHPDIFDFVEQGKKIGYKKIQVITNGRMFSSKDFTNNIISAGLDEVTFSIHGLNSEMHDSLTKVPGSFKQIMLGVKNVYSNPKKMIVNTDTCITNSNYFYLPQIIRFIVEKIGIREVNLMSLVPQGSAWKNKEEVMYDYEIVAPFVHKVIDYCVKNDVVLWLSRFPAKYLEGYEAFIEDPYKLVDEVRGRINMFRSNNLSCKGEKCNYCNLDNVCSDILKLNYTKKKVKDSITITKENYDIISERVVSGQKTYLSLPKPTQKLSNYLVDQLDDVAVFLKGIDNINVYVEGIPSCVLFKKGIKNINIYSDFEKRGSNYFKNVEVIALHSKIKRKSCKACVFDDRCKGVYQNYIRKYGFSELVPIKSKEISVLNITK